MRIEPRILDGNIEKKSLYEKKQTQQKDPVVESYDALFMDHEQILAEGLLSRQEVIDDEDRQAAFDARSIGKAFVPEMDTQEVENASHQEAYENASKELMEMFGIKPEEMDKITSQLEDAIRDSF